MKNKKILITGCAGFIGFHLCKRLISNGYTVIGIDNINNYYDTKLKEDRLNIIFKEKRFKFYKINLLDDKSLDEIFQAHKIKFIIHLAAQAGVRYSLENPLAYVNANITSFVNVMQKCKEHKINIIYASSSSVYGDSNDFPLSEDQTCNKPLSIYGSTKLFNELAAYNYFYLYKISSIGLRFFTVYGPWGRPDMALYKFTTNILENKKIDVYNHGKHSRSFTYIDDIIDAIDLLIEKYIDIGDNYYDILNIGGERSINLSKFINTIEEKLKLKAKINYLPKQLGDVEKTESDCSKISSLVNYYPKVSIKHGVSNFINWYKDYYKK